MGKVAPFSVLKRWLIVLGVFITLGLAVGVIYAVDNFDDDKLETAKMTDLSVTEETTLSPTPTEEPTPTVRSAYIPQMDEISDLPDVEFLAASSAPLAIEHTEDGLVVTWKDLFNVDYFIVLLIDDDRNLIPHEICLNQTLSWTFVDFNAQGVAVLGYADGGQDSFADDLLVRKFIYEIPKPTQPPRQTTPRPTAVPVDYKYEIVVDKSAFAFGVYAKDDDGNYTRLVRVFPCAHGGTKTPVGVRKISGKWLWHQWGSTSYSPYNSGYLGYLKFHGPLYSAKTFNRLKEASYIGIGTATTAGCIRTTVAGARWVYNNCPSGTTVRVVSGGSGLSYPGKPTIDPAYPGWDPTDPEHPNRLPTEAPTPTPEPTLTPTPEPTPEPTPTPTEDPGGE